jgi:hypothetical protein
MCRGGTNASAHCLDFQYNDFRDVFSIVQQKTAFVCEFQHTSLWNFSFSLFHTSCGYETPYLLWI